MSLSISSILLSAPACPADHEDGTPAVVCALPLLVEVPSRLGGGPPTLVLDGRVDARQERGFGPSAVDLLRRALRRGPRGSESVKVTVPPVLRRCA